MRTSIRGILSALPALTLAACQAAGSPQIISVVSTDGIPIRYETQGTGDPALLFVHGWSGDRTYWKHQVNFFAADHRVVTIDLAGHGSSGIERVNWSIPAFAEDVRRVAEDLDLRRVILVGHAMGGPVIVEAARLMPERVIALVPVDSLLDVERRYTSKEREEFLNPLRENFRNRTEEFVRKYMFEPDTDPKLIERIALDMSSAPPSVGIGAMEALLSFDLPTSLAQVQAPIRCINASRYPTNLEAGQRFHSSFDVSLMSGVSHFLMLESPATFNRLLAKAVRDLTPRDL
ncbi:MAG: alpha/beta hydrolase [Acidobacteriota bacterium]